MIDVCVFILIVKCFIDFFLFVIWLYLFELDSFDLVGFVFIGWGWNCMYEGEGIFGVCSILYCIFYFVFMMVCMLLFNVFVLFFLYLYLYFLCLKFIFRMLLIGFWYILLLWWYFSLIVFGCCYIFGNILLFLKII